MAHLTAIFNGPDNAINFHFIRELTPQQFAEFERVLTEFTALSQKFSLLHILELNFQALNSFIDKLQSVNTPLNTHNLYSEGNRHFMNYLSSAYSVRAHIETSLKREFGRKSQHSSKFLDFFNLLTKKSFEYAFFQDFRGFVQHCGFPIGEMSLTENLGARILTIKYPKAALLENYNGWKYCDLQKRPEDEFDLIALIRGHHRIVTQEFPVVIQAIYGTNLDGIESYFSGLQNEAKAINENAVAKIVLSMPPAPPEGTPPEGTITTLDVPLNTISQLGLSRKAVGKEMTLLSHEIEKHDRYFDVRKSDIVSFHPAFKNLDYDPYPEAKNDDVVRRVLVGRELILRAKLKTSMTVINPGTLIELDGHKFALNKIRSQFNVGPGINQAIFDVEGSELLVIAEPIKIITEMRSELAAQRM